MRFVVAGTGRCGTGYMSEALTALGFPCGHEAVFDHDYTTSGSEARWDQVGRGNVVGDSSLATVAHFRSDPSMRVIHLVRDPIATIESFVATAFFADTCTGRCGHPDGAHLTAPYFQFMRRVLPSVGRESDEVGRAIRWVVESNRLIAIRASRFKMKYLLVHLERMPEDLVAVSSLLGRPLPLSAVTHLVSHLGEHVNQNQYVRSSREDAVDRVRSHPLYPLVLQHQRTYGYED